MKASGWTSKEKTLQCQKKILTGSVIMKTIAIICLMLGSISINPMSSQAADLETQNTFEDAAYGGALGALIGAGAMLVSSSSDWKYLLRGAGVGIIAGAAYGVASSTGALATIEDGQLNLSTPIPQLAMAPNGEELALGISLLETHF